MKLNELKSNEGSMKPRKRVGRGLGSGTGKTSGRGQKGQKSRTGVSLNGFEGGQMPLYRRLPKRGFNNVHAKDFNAVNLGRIQQAFDAKKLDAKKPVDAVALKEAGVISKLKDGVRILAQGELKTKADFTACGASEAAKTAIEKAGGKLTIAEFKHPKFAQSNEKKATKAKSKDAKPKAAKAKKDA